MLLVGYAVVVFLGVYIGSINDLENQLVDYRVDRGDGGRVGVDSRVILVVDDVVVCVRRKCIDSCL